LVCEHFQDMAIIWPRWRARRRLRSFERVEAAETRAKGSLFEKPYRNLCPHQQFSAQTVPPYTLTCLSVTQVTAVASVRRIAGLGYKGKTLRKTHGEVVAELNFSREADVFGSCCHKAAPLSFAR
jgi:hypothetical protein